MITDIPAAATNAPLLSAIQEVSCGLLGALNRQTAVDQHQCLQNVYTYYAAPSVYMYSVISSTLCSAGIIITAELFDRARAPVVKCSAWQVISYSGSL
jgi:hypothetical protein